VLCKHATAIFKPKWISKPLQINTV